MGPGTYSSTRFPGRQERLGNANGAVCPAGPDRGARLSVARHAGHPDEQHPVTALLSRPRIQGGEYSPAAPADTGQYPEHQPPADSGTPTAGDRGGDVTVNGQDAPIAE
ncbi:MAG TPA: hypothetical protein VF070_39430 [Streptosporangiaceae bacterium]